MLGVERMPLRLFTDGMDQAGVDLFVGGDKSFPNKRGPMFFRDRSERIMTTRAVERSRAIHEHFFDQMLPAPEKEVGDFTVVLDDAPKFFFHSITAVFEDLLKFVEHDDDITMVLGRNLRGSLQDFVQGRNETGVPGYSEVNRRPSFLVERHARRQTAEEVFPGFQELPTEELIDWVMALASAVTKVASLSVGQRST